MSTATIRVTAADHGRRMSYDEYLLTEGEEGLFYELGRGVLNVIEVPNWRHGIRVALCRNQLVTYQHRCPDRIHWIASGGECRLPIASLESDRHPDLAIYSSGPPKDAPADEFWSLWIPDVVIEVVSPSSVHRDYEEKPEEYRQFGVKEYWVVDPEKEAMLVHRRLAGQWKKIPVSPAEIYKTPLFPGLEFSLSAVLTETIG